MENQNSSYDFTPINPTHTCKAYLIRPENSEEIALVDPQLDHLQDYIDLIEAKNYKLKMVIDTHTHADHLSAAAALREKYESMLIMGAKAPAKCVTHRVKEGDVISLGDIPMKIIETPGHTLDSISIVLPGRILTGDVLFLDEGGAGRDDLPGGSPELHWQSLEKLKRLPEDLVVFPAHDYRGRTPTTLGVQKQRNEFLKFSNQADFVDFINDLILGPAEWMKDVLKANYQCSQDVKAAWVPLDSPSCEVMGTLDPTLEKYPVEEIEPVSLSEMLEKREDFVFLDVRAKKELDGKFGPLPEAKHIPLSSIMNDVSQLSQWRDKKVVTICGSGKRAKIAAQMLKKSGFSAPGYVVGGLKKWKGIPKT